jgi:hypothetical protein
MSKEVEDLTKAIDTVVQMAEALKKSQMNLFGDPHHVGYTRTSASGAVSTIAAKNPHEKAHTIQERPSHVGAASEEAEDYSKTAWISDDTKDGHDAAEAALTHSASLHEKAAEEADRFGDPRTSKWHARKADLHRQMAEEHGAESHRMWTNEQQARVTAPPAPTEHDQHVAKLVAMTHEAVGNIAKDPKMAQHSEHIARKLEALKANPTAKAAHNVLSDVKMLAEKAAGPKVMTEAEAGKHLTKLANHSTTNMHSKLDRFSESHGYHEIPSGKITGAEARQHEFSEVYGPSPKRYGGDVVPGGSEFSDSFMDKQEANNHSPFILKHTNGNRYLVDPQGYNYARYISKIKEEPKQEQPVTVETADQTGYKIPAPAAKAPIPTSRVSVLDNEHMMAHGHDPRGTGQWMFSKHRKIDFGTHKEGEDYITTPRMSYTAAKKHAKQWAASKGHGSIWTMP